VAIKTYNGRNRPPLSRHFEEIAAFYQPVFGLYLSDSVFVAQYGVSNVSEELATMPRRGAGINPIPWAPEQVVTDAVPGEHRWLDTLFYRGGELAVDLKAAHHLAPRPEQAGRFLHAAAMRAENTTCKVSIPQTIIRRPRPRLIKNGPSDRLLKWRDLAKGGIEMTMDKEGRGGWTGVRRSVRGGTMSIWSA